MSMHLMRPEWLWALLPAVLLALTLWRQGQRSGSWSSIIAPELLPHLLGPEAGARRRNLAPLILVAWVIATIAASGPSWRKIPQPVHQAQDALILVLDLSYSMVAADLAPSRIDRARQKVLDLLEQRNEGQTGLIAYAGDAHTVTPLTDDTPTIANLLPALHPNIMPVPGSEPSAAVEQALALLHSAGIRSGRILLLTDAISDADRGELTKLMAGSDAKLSVLGIGTASGAPLPLPRGGFIKDDSGAIVMPTLEEGELRALAAAVGGRYMRMQIDNADLDYLLAEEPLGMAGETLALDRAADTWEDQGYWLVALLLLPALALFRRGWLVCLAPLFLLPQAPPAQAGLWDDLWLTRDQQGQRALSQEDPATAATLFEDDNWAGTAAYRDGDYENAALRFSESDTADAWYNRGNALARTGQLEAAMEAYRESLAREPERADALENLALLEQLQQQEQQQQQQGDSSEDQGEQQDPQDSQHQDDQQQSEGDQQQDGQQQEGEQQGQQQDQSSSRDQDSQSGEEDSATAEGQSAQEQTTGQATGAEEDAQSEPGEELMDMASAAAEAANPEKEQAMEQWLRRVPDDPSGLLREKFRYESRQRQQQGKGKDNDTYW